jgi:D-glycero-D-manno-heptose 1,7-bisphosphate phosphatase
LQLNELEVHPDAIDFVKRILNNGNHIAIVTNQQCVGLGLLSISELNEINDKLIKSLDLSKDDVKIYSCIHLADTCFCRKPSPLLLHEAMQFYNCKPNEAIFFGDQISDKIAADEAGVDFVFVDRQGSTISSKSLGKVVIQSFDDIRST